MYRPTFDEKVKLHLLKQTNWPTWICQKLSYINSRSTDKWQKYLHHIYPAPLQYSHLHYYAGI